MSMLYFVFQCLRVIASIGNLSLQYVNAMNYIVEVEEEENGGLKIGDVPLKKRMSSLKRARHLQWRKKQMHGNIQEDNKCKYGKVDSS